MSDDGPEEDDVGDGRSRLPLAVALVWGSPCLAAAINLGVLAVGCALGPGAVSSVSVDLFVLLNATLAVLGSGAGGLMIPGGTAERVGLALAAAAVGMLVYSSLTCVGGLGILAVADRLQG